MSGVAMPVPAASSLHRIAGFWMASPTVLAYQVEDGKGDRYTMEVEFASPEEAKSRCPEAIRAITEAVRIEGLVGPVKASYLTAVADLIGDWVVDLMTRRVSVVR